MKLLYRKNLAYESASVSLRVWDDGEAFVVDLFSKIRGQGHASALMRKVVDFADQENLTLFVEVQRFGHPVGPDNHILVEFYKKFGFEATAYRNRELPNRAYMIRTPITISEESQLLQGS